MTAPAGLFDRFGQECRAGTVLFRAGEPGVAMFVILTGAVRISRVSGDAEKTLALLGPGEFFGELAILNDRPRSATATVVDDAKLLVIEAKTFEEMVTSNTEIAVRLIKRLAQRLAAADEMIALLWHRDPSARVVLYLERLMQASGAPREDGSVVLASSAATIAEDVALAPAEADDVLRRLKRLGIVREAEEGVVVPSPTRLQEFLEFLSSRAREGGA